MTTALKSEPIIYPESHGQPMAENTKQFHWIVLIKENLEYLFSQDQNVFVAGDLFWYPMEGRPDIRIAPNVMVIFGRPKGDRGSYRQWQEDHIPPQVVFEVLSPSNTIREMNRKLLFYDHHVVEEYYIYDPDRNELTGCDRQAEGLTTIESMDGWISPCLGIRFALTPETLNIYDPQGNLFLSPVEMKTRAEQEKARADRLANKLRELGIDPEEV